MSPRALVTLIDDVETGVASGTFHARVPVSRERVRELSRSWEAFDRAFERLEATAERALLEAALWPALDRGELVHVSEAEANSVAFTLPGDHLGIWPGELWSTQLAEWRAARRQAKP
ncbi:MAG: hypothetical protein GXP55_26410 [Deltaproteobacteria bacterium]|nr:hypothetical protein [Deltaproteobacteria bacterium]